MTYSSSTYDTCSYVRKETPKWARSWVAGTKQDSLLFVRWYLLLWKRNTHAPRGLETLLSLLFSRIKGGVRTWKPKKRFAAVRKQTHLPPAKVKCYSGCLLEGTSVWEFTADVFLNIIKRMHKAHARTMFRFFTYIAPTGIYPVCDNLVWTFLCCCCSLARAQCLRCGTRRPHAFGLARAHKTLIDLLRVALTYSYVGWCIGISYFIYTSRFSLLSTWSVRQVTSGPFVKPFTVRGIWP